MLKKLIDLNGLNTVYTLYPLQKVAFGGSLRFTSMQASINDQLISLFPVPLNICFVHMFYLP